MKHISLITLLFCLSCIGTAKGATISGRVTSVASCAFVSGQKVYVTDSTTGWLDSTTTNTSGQYSFTIPSSVVISSKIYLYTYSCGSIAVNNIAHTGNNTWCNLHVCGGYSVMYGIVFLGTTTAAGPSVVYLIRRDVNPITLDTSLVAVDSALSYATGSYNLRYACTPTGTFLVKAALLPAHTNYSSYLPTYYGNTLNWNGGTLLTAINFGSRIDVNLIAGTNPGGPAFIGGSVLLGANKTTGVGDPLSSRILILTDASSGQAVAYTYSDAAGKFQFSSVPYGTYKIFGDAMGKSNPKLNVTVSAAQKTVDNIVFEENSKKFEGRINSLGISKMSAFGGVRVFPNPAGDFISVEGAAGGIASVVSIVGQTVLSNSITTAQQNISIATLPSGSYILQITSKNGASSVQRFVKE